MNAIKKLQNEVDKIKSNHDVLERYNQEVQEIDKEITELNQRDNDVNAEPLTVNERIRLSQLEKIIVETKGKQIKQQSVLDNGLSLNQEHILSLLISDVLSECYQEKENELSELHASMQEKVQALLEESAKYNAKHNEIKDYAVELIKQTGIFNYVHANIVRNGINRAIPSKELPLNTVMLEQLGEVTQWAKQAEDNEKERIRQKEMKERNEKAQKEREEAQRRHEEDKTRQQREYREQRAAKDKKEGFVTVKNDIYPSR